MIKKLEKDDIPKNLENFWRNLDENFQKEI